MIHMYCGILLGNKKKGILPFFTTWMEFENIMLSEINQTDTLRYREQIDGYLGGRGLEGG